MEVRELEDRDYDSVFHLWERSGLESLRPKGRDSREEFSKQIQTGRNLVLGLERGKELIGVVVATDDGRKGWINRLVIAEEHQHRGYARHLLAAAESRLAARGLRIISALIEDDNAASLALFQSEGYKLLPSIRYLAKKENPDV